MESREDKYFRAKQRVADLKKFYRGLVSFVLVNGMLAGINYYTNQWSDMWFLWVTFFWGIGLLFETAKVFGMRLFFGSDWESRKIKKLMEEDEGEDEVKFNRWE